ncbi:MAG: YebC/PmpR family DNA-binding transcriptional regulator [Candidatus Gracilibacteria bacterium]|jgi:YebC/PmpR family DNA-binding regulatory protein
MSGHSKWHSIKHKKGAIDAKRGKIFTRHAKLIEIAARSGGDPSMNPGLRLALDNARADNLPNLNIERAIRKGTGEDKDSAVLVETIYEGYAPGGVALYIETISDNKNRTVSNIRSTLLKHGGNLGAAGCVGWMFEKKGMIALKPTSLLQDDVEMKIIDSGASDFKKDEDIYLVYTALSDLHTVAKNLVAVGLEVDKQEVTYIPKTMTQVTDKAMAEKIIGLLETLDEDEDVTNVSMNCELPEES